MNKVILDCNSASCYFSIDKSGQRNNGPCKCLPGTRRGTATRLLRELIQENAALRIALNEITAAVVEGDPQTIADVIEHTRNI